MTLVPPPETIAHDAAAILPTTAFTGLAGWDKLSQQEQATVQTEGQLLAQAMLMNGYSRLAIGAHLTNVQPILTPHNIFNKFCSKFRFSKRTANRYILGFKNAKATLPDSILKAAMARGVDIFGDSNEKPLGIYTAAAAKLPPPKEATTEQANTWLDQVDKVRREIKSTGSETVATGLTLLPVPSDPGTLLKECYRFISIRYKRLPNNVKSRQKFVNSLMGMLAAEFGATGPQTFSPVAIPEDFRAQRGRPALTATA